MTDPVCVEKHGTTVTKAADFGTDDDVRVRLTIESEWSKSITVRVRDSIPSEGTVGIPGDQDEYWDVSDDELSYERVLEPESTVRTEYRVDVDDPDSAIDDLRVQPEVGVASAPDAVTETGPHVRGEGVSTFSGPSARAVCGPTAKRVADAAVDDASADDVVDDTVRPGPSKGIRETSTPDARRLFESLDGFSMPEDDDVETAAVLAEDIGPQDPDESAPDVESDATDAESADEVSEGVIDRETAAESGADDPHPGFGDDRTEATEGVDEDPRAGQEDAVADEYPERVRRDATDAEPRRASLEVRVRYLQSQFEDLAAYIDAMEEFIDECGTGNQILTALTTDLEAVKERSNSIQSDQTTLQRRLETDEDSLETLRSRVDTCENSVDDGLDELADVVDAVETTQKEMEADIEELKTFRKKLQDAV